MQYLKLQCDNYPCNCEFLVALDEWYKKEYEGIRSYFTCPICDMSAWINGEPKIVDIPEYIFLNRSVEDPAKYYTDED
jgi:hypothetical protein